jgi:hypothetical protein
MSERAGGEHTTLSKHSIHLRTGIHGSNSDYVLFVIDLRTIVSAIEHENGTLLFAFLNAQYKVWCASGYNTGLMLAKYL